MRQIVSFLLTAGAVVPLFWASVLPHADKFCPRDSKDTLIPYTVVRPDRFGTAQTLTFGGHEQQNLCEAILY